MDREHQAAGLGRAPDFAALYRGQIGFIPPGAPRFFVGEPLKGVEAVGQRVLERPRQRVGGERGLIADLD